MQKEIRRIYVDRSPQVGDKVIALRDSEVCGFRKGYEYEVRLLADGCIGVTGDRMPHDREMIAITDGAYTIYEDYEKVIKETHEKVYKFLSVPLVKRYVTVYEENLVDKK